MLRCTGSYLEKTIFGFFKKRFMCLTNKEIYFYNDKEAAKNEP